MFDNEIGTVSQHLRAGVDEPREIGGVVRHANEQVLRSRRRGRVRRRRDVGRKVDVVCTHDVGMTQLAHEQNLHDGQSAKSVAGGCSFSARRCVAEGGRPRAGTAAARGRSRILFS